MIDPANLEKKFTARYNTGPRTFRAPGRVNLIGEHTDYNDGFVLPAALDFATYAACAPRNDRRVRVATLTLEREFEFSLDDPPNDSFPAWTEYVQGIALILERSGYPLKGADILIDSDVPIGSGLSSSAALEVSIGSAFAGLNGHKVTGMELAKIGQSAEHEFAGVRSGIMDQFAAVFGKAGHALFLDCRSLEYEAVPVGEAKFIICNTKVKHDLAESEYNKRRLQCEEAAAFFGRPSLRDVSAGDLEKRSGDLPELLLKRARHVITENERVVNAVKALRSGDLAAFGNLMNRSHNSLRDDFEVSCRELDIMVEIARRQPGVLGARMTGGGFGGCTINLVEAGFHRDLISKVSSEYLAETGIEPEIYRCEIADGAEEIV
ncbi:MAG: galactokinase [Acidobacteria bacterium]|nr:galactokinase [Acidobacteriota bacterium]